MRVASTLGLVLLLGLSGWLGCSSGGGSGGGADSGGGNGETGADTNLVGETGGSGGDTGSGSGSGGDDGGSCDGSSDADACSACLGCFCQAEELACGSDPTCVNEIGCINDCFNHPPDAMTVSACQDACKTHYASSKADADLACGSTHCMSQCSM